MTLILTHISKFGIIHAADSNLSNGTGACGTGTKVFEIPSLAAGVAFAGRFTVNGIRVDSWLPDLISKYSQVTAPTISGFAETLRSQLESQMTAHEKSDRSIAHIAGYANAQGHHPEFYSVRNFADQNANGEYMPAEPTFSVREDFWSGNFRDPLTRAGLTGGSIQLVYINGFPAGRIGYLGLSSHLREFLEAVWKEPNWHFRPPKTLQEYADLVTLQFGVIGTLFKISDYPAPYIGGEVRTVLLEPPDRTQPFGNWEA